MFRRTNGPTRGNRLGRRLLRSAQVWVPGARVARLWLERAVLGVLRRPHEQDFAALGLLGLPDDALVVDVGANVGQSVASIRLAIPGATVVSFEPNPWCADALAAHHRSDDRVHVERVGLGAAPEERQLYVPVYGRYRFDGLASFDRASAEGWLDPTTVLAFRPDRLRIETVPCSIRPLDDFALEPQVVKIDVQGLELDVVRGASTTIERHRPVLMVEDVRFAGPMEELLGGLGYRMFRFHAPATFAEVTGHGDNTFLLTEDHLGALPATAEVVRSPEITADGPGGRLT